MSSSASISVIIPAYNAQDFIGEAIESVQSQNITDLQIIVVDDGSTDGTAEKVSHGYPNVTLVHKQNGGAATARNAGIASAQGDYIAFLDADDLWLPGKLSVQYQHLKTHPDIQLVCTRFARWDQNADGTYPPLDRLIAEAEAIPEGELEDHLSGWVYHKLLLSCYVWTSTVMMRRSLLAKIGNFDESLRLGQDYDFWLRASRITQIHTLRRPMALYRQHPDSATVRGAPINYGARVITQAIKRWGYSSPDGNSVPARQVKKRIAGMHFDLGYRRYGQGMYSLAKNDFTSSLLQSPWQPRTWIYLLVSNILMFTSKRSASSR